MCRNFSVKREALKYVIFWWRNTVLPINERGWEIVTLLLCCIVLIICPISNVEIFQFSHSWKQPSRHFGKLGCPTYLSYTCRKILVILSCKPALHCRGLFYITLYNSAEIFFCSEVVMVLISWRDIMQGVGNCMFAIYFIPFWKGNSSVNTGFCR